ncbi:GNAT family N-acetyltransferase [Parvularcula lutaonensis]|uniref:GNAT family N-acetyltransferase n=1 Tax=Parvularcula lutaonensis TaxID=491923 RepID=A0ABV7M8T4_9PROT|nr:GNAT family N-acetyltransferase [Parvularcula lutaonensis]GGY45390.1 hypothetical protein GCM10007148_12960 [Parvularcula lutaonensis]
MPHTIRTERLVLRPAGLRGARAFWHEVRGWDVLGNTSAWPYPLSYAHTVFMLRKAWLEDEGAYVFYPTLAGRPIGSIGLHRQTESVFSLGYMLGREHWGRGYATELVRAMTRFGFRQLRLEQITADVAVWNSGSRRVLLKNGFRPTGRTFAGYSQAHRREIAHDSFVLDLVDIH